MSCKKGLSTKEAKYVYSKGKNKEVLGSEQVYEYSSDEEKCDFDSNLYECAKLNDFKFYNAHTECAEKESGPFIGQKLIMLRAIERY